MKFWFKRTSWTKSSVINPLLWAQVIFLTGLLAVIGEEAPRWVPIFFAALMGATALLMIWAYIHCIVRDPSVLRSEKSFIPHEESAQESNPENASV